MGFIGEWGGERRETDRPAAQDPRQGVDVADLAESSEGAKTADSSASATFATSGKLSDSQGRRPLGEAVLVVHYTIIPGPRSPPSPIAMITIVDYQMGNLRSVQKAIERGGVEARISSDAREIAAAEKLVLPGVGAFGDAMREIRRRGLAGPICDFIDSGKPFLGICLGLQLLFETGYEHGEHQGLGVLAGDVVRFELPATFKVPHMGWNAVTRRSDPPILQGIPDGSHFYFVHSYYVRPADPSVVALSCDYGGEFCAMVWRDNLFATQFHPEKSQTDGLRLMAGFAKL